MATKKVAKKKTPKKKKKKLILTKSYSITQLHYDDGTITEKRKTDGYGGDELLGLLERVQLEIMWQHIGNLNPPDLIEKLYLVEGKIKARTKATVRAKKK